MLRSILAQMEYSFEVCKWDEVGVPFRTYMYVPEVHHITKEPFLEREDEGHVFKVIACMVTLFWPSVDCRCLLFINNFRELGLALGWVDQIS